VEGLEERRDKCTSEASEATVIERIAHFPSGTSS
jgi:hypothetical protein